MMRAWIGRNVRLYFKDKGMFFTSLITPAILLVLYVSFLGNVFRDAFSSAFAAFGPVEDSLLGSLVGGQVISSLLAVSCVTVSFCSNYIMIQDKISGARTDFAVSPVNGSFLAIGYFAANLISALLVCFGAAALCFGYLAVIGWCWTVEDVLLILSDVVLLVFFGTALSSLIHHFLSTRGQMSAVGTIVSSGYGFICGAYMPISQFSPALQKVLVFLPGTYGTVLLRSHAMAGPFRRLADAGMPKEAIEETRLAMDCRIKFFDHTVPTWTMYAILGGSILLICAAYVWIHRVESKRAAR